ncbi:unnamed protein product, partial [Phaeothamnion confervicola]
PLHAACSKGRWTSARRLLDVAPTLAQAKDKRGLTPGGLAARRGLAIPDSLPELTSLAAAATVGTAPLVVASEDGKECTTLILRHELCLEHHSCRPFHRYASSPREGTPPPPPENVNRLKVIYDADRGVLSSGEFAALRWEDHPPRAQIADVLRVHEYVYVEKLQRICRRIPAPNGVASLDPDTAISHRSFEAAMRAAGAVCSAVDRVVGGQNRNAFCAVRPPGHHAGPRGIVPHDGGDDSGSSHGFCLLNNVAIGAAYARHMYRAQGINKVAIVDFDVHHGNGTEEIVRWLVPSMEAAKVQLGPFCAGTARSEEPLIFDIGMGLGAQDEVPGASRLRWRDAHRKQIFPVLMAFKPDLILVSAGFDAHRKDAAVNTGFIGLVEEDYEWVTAQLVAVANACCGGRIVSVLEGGYHIQGGPVSAFGRSVAAHVRALMDGCRSRESWSVESAAAESEMEGALQAERERKRRLKLQAEALAQLERIRQQELRYQERIAEIDMAAAAGGASSGAGADVGDAHVTDGGEGGGTGGIESGSGGNGGETAEEGGVGDGNAQPRKRRRGAPVDYVALAKQME